MRLVRDNRGQTLFLTALSLTALLGFAGLATDVGVLFHAQRELQIAADAGATAAAMDITYGLSASAAADAKTAVINNGWSGATLVSNSNPPTSSTSLSAPQVTVNIAPLSGYHETSSFAEVYVTEPNPTFFMKLFGFNTQNVTARAVAGSPGAGAECIYLMDPTDYDLKLQGSETINAAGCGIYINSNNTTSIITTGGSNTVNTPFIDTVGGDGSGADAPGGNNIVNTNVAPQSDPLPQAANTGPTLPSGCNTTVSKLPSGTTIDAAGGVYCVTGNNPSIDGYTLQNGVFVFEHGVTTGTSTVGTTTLPATLEVSGGAFTQNNGILTIHSPTTGSYNGVALLVPASNTTYDNTPCQTNKTGNNAAQGSLQVQFGSSYENIDGFIVAPGAEIYLQDNGGSVTTTGIIAQCMFSKSSTVNITSYNTAHPTTTPIRKIALVE